MLVYILSTITLILPVYGLFEIIRSQKKSGIQRLLNVIIAIAIVVFSFFGGIWGFVCYYLRYLLILIFLFAFYKCILMKKPLASTNKNSRRSYLYIWSRIFLLMLLIFLNVLLIKGLFIYGVRPLELDFPLRNGSYYIFQGGNSPVSNFFHSLYPESKYALDVVKLNKLGNRAYGLYPKSLDRYSIFGDLIYSPSDGQIMEAVSDFPDNSPPKVDLVNTAGNHVLIERGEFEILLAHLQYSSITVKPGDFVKKGQIIGRVGSSGNSSEPHLHMSVTKRVKDGQQTKKIAIPMVFDKRFYSLNSVIRNNQF